MQKICNNCLVQYFEHSQSIKNLCLTFILFVCECRAKELKMLELKFKRKLNALKVLNENMEFTYEIPQMEYDRATGDVTILEK